MNEKRLPITDHLRTVAVTGVVTIPVTNAGIILRPPSRRLTGQLEAGGATPNTLGGSFTAELTGHQLLMPAPPFSRCLSR